jgi:hypothetical protein
MNTLLIRIEACLNSRPITPISSDPNDLQPLTPGHFLIGEPLNCFPEYDFTEVPINRFGTLGVRGTSSPTILEKVDQGIFNSVAVEVQVEDRCCDNGFPRHWKDGRISRIYRHFSGKLAELSKRILATMARFVL